MKDTVPDGTVPNGISNVDLVATMDEDQIAIGALQRRQLAHLAEFDRRAAWKNSGAKDMAGWVSARYGVSPYRAARMVAAGYALESLPVTAVALESGRLNLDRVVEVVRLATPETEAGLVKWARRVTPQWICHRADLAERQRTVANKKAESSRSLQWWWSGSTLWVNASLPSDAGRRFIAAIDDLADKVPCSPDPRDHTTVHSRRADALVALATDHLAGDGNDDAAAVVVHAGLEVLLGKNLSGDIEDGPVIHADVVRRLLCDGRIEVVCHDSDGKACRIGTEEYKIPRHIRRQVLRRDGRRRTFSVIGLDFGVPPPAQARLRRAHRSVAAGRDGARQPHLPVPASPQAGTRARLEGAPHQGRSHRMVPTQRRQVRSGTGSEGRATQDGVAGDRVVPSHRISLEDPAGRRTFGACAPQAFHLLKSL